MKPIRGIGLAGIMVIASAMVIAPAASAEPPWPIQQTMNVPGISTTLDGDAVLSECFPQSHNRDYWSQTFNSFGQQVGSVENTGQSYVEACGSFVGRDNRRITLERTSANPSQSVIAGYEDDQQIWAYTPSTNCSSGIRGLLAKGVAGNGTTAYLLMSNGCGSDPMFGGMELVGLSMATGAVQFQQQLPSVPTYGDIQPYLNGYVYYVSGQGFKYLNSSGVEDSSKAFSTSDSVRGWAVGAGGELAVLYSGTSGSGCTQYLVLRNSNETMYRNIAPSSGCMYQTVHVTPTGGAVVAGYANYMYMQDFSLVDETSAPPVKKITAAKKTSTSVQVDVNGNILATDHDGVTVYSAMGLQIRRVNFVDHVPALSSVYFDSKVAFTDGRMYIVAQQYPPPGPYGNYPTYLAKVTAAEVGIDYPRGTFLGDTSNPAEPFIEYYAMGDSYSAGEGVPAFDSGTDNPGVNECHRSPKAYGRVLAQAESFNLTHFVACSGAKADRLTSTWPSPGKNTDEDAQWEHLRPCLTWI